MFGSPWLACFQKLEFTFSFAPTEALDNALKKNIFIHKEATAA